MSDKLRAAALLALDALDSDDPTIQTRAALSLRAALAEPEEKLLSIHRLDQWLKASLAEPAIKESLTVQRPWVGLTGTEINHIFARNVGYPESMMKEVETLLKEKNT